MNSKKNHWCRPSDLIRPSDLLSVAFITQKIYFMKQIAYLSRWPMDDTVTSTTSVSNSSLETISFEDLYCSACLHPVHEDLTELIAAEPEETFFTVGSTLFLCCGQCRNIYHLHCLTGALSVTAIIDTLQHLPFSCHNCENE
jgi:hypothetical protein